MSLLESVEYGIDPYKYSSSEHEDANTLETNATTYVVGPEYTDTQRYTTYYRTNHIERDYEYREGGGGDIVFNKTDNQDTGMLDSRTTSIDYSFQVTESDSGTETAVEGPAWDWSTYLTTFSSFMSTEYEVTSMSSSNYSGITIGDTDYTLAYNSAAGTTVSWSYSWTQSTSWSSSSHATRTVTGTIASVKDDDDSDGGGNGSATGSYTDTNDGTLDETVIEYEASRAYNPALSTATFTENTYTASTIEGNINTLTVVTDGAVTRNTTTSSTSAQSWDVAVESEFTKETYSLETTGEFVVNKIGTTVYIASDPCCDVAFNTGITDGAILRCSELFTVTDSTNRESPMITGSGKD